MLELKDTNLFLLGFPKCATTAFAQWLDASPDVELSVPKETYHFCPEFNEVHPREAFLGFKGGAIYNLEACTWNIYSKELLDAISNVQDVKVIIMIRDLHDVVSSWFHQMKKAGLAGNGLSIQSVWDESDGVTAVKSGRDLLANFKLCVLHGHWVEKWVNLLGDERVLILRAEDMRGDKFLDSAKPSLVNFLPEVCFMSDRVEEKNSHSIPRSRFLYSLLRVSWVKSAWYGLEYRASFLRGLRVAIRERFLLKKIEKERSDISFVLGDTDVIADRSLLDDLYHRNSVFWRG